MTDWLVIEEIDQPCEICGDDPMKPCRRCEARERREAAEQFGAEVRGGWND